MERTVAQLVLNVRLDALLQQELHHRHLHVVVT